MPLLELGCRECILAVHQGSRGASDSKNHVLAARTAYAHAALFNPIGKMVSSATAALQKGIHCMETRQRAAGPSVMMQ